MLDPEEFLGLVAEQAPARRALGRQRLRARAGPLRHHRGAGRAGPGPGVRAPRRAAPPLRPRGHLQHVHPQPADPGQRPPRQPAARTTVPDQRDRRDRGARGRQLGFPTANIRPDPRRALRPTASTRPWSRSTASSIGPWRTSGRARRSRRASGCWKSTCSTPRPTCTAKPLDVDFVDRLRDTQRFDSIDALRAQIARDCGRRPDDRSQPVSGAVGRAQPSRSATASDTSGNASGAMVAQDVLCQPPKVTSFLVGTLTAVCDGRGRHGGQAAASPPAPGMVS